ncbi:MAG: amidohydrolase family protein [Planctomycetes bacterium]|nr:amidohydrolase family protein [Planctomycetota bacterium]
MTSSRKVFAHVVAGLLTLACPLAAQEHDHDHDDDAPQPASDDAVLVLRGATVHGPRGPIPRGVVVVVNGRIAAVGAEGEVALPPGGARVFLGGQHLYPGLIDADTILGLTEIGSVAATNDTSEVGDVNPNLRAELGVNPDSELLPVARTGGVLVALTALRTGLLSGTSALIYTQGWTWEDMTVRAPAALHVRWPRMRVDPVGRSEKELREAVEAREAKLRAIDEALAEARAYWRARKEAGVTRRPDRDPKWDAMRGVVEQRIPVAVEADGVLELRAALDWADRERLRLIVVGGQEAWRLADALAMRDVPVIVGTPFELPARDDDPIDAPYRNAAVLHAAGVRIAFGSGGHGFAAANARHLRLHAAQAVAHGLPREAALHALTAGAAEILGVGERLGALEAGREATLFAATGDILDTRTEVTAAWIGGQPVDLHDRQRRLYERYRRR